MNAKPRLLLRSAHLENFVLHKDTFVEFERPIMLLTGGNSSGKTLFLEALLLALGIKSQRIRDGKIGAIIGGNGKTTRVTVQINNPEIKGRRLIWFDNYQLDEMIDNNVFSMGFELSAKDSNLNYFILSDRKKHTITLSLLTQLLDRINLDTRNKLVFTESGDVSELVSSSPRKRFETLLRITGMQDRFTQVAELTEKSAELTPILQRLREENNRRENELNELKRIREEMMEKDYLSDRRKFLQGALIWCEVLEIRERVGKILDRLNDLKYQDKELKADLKIEQESLENINAKLLNLNSLRLEEERSQHKIVRAENDLKHEIDTLQKDIAKLERELETYNDNLAKLEPVNDEYLENAKFKQAELSQKYDDADAEFKNLQKEINKLTGIANLLKRDGQGIETVNEIDEQIFSAIKLSIILKNLGAKFWGPLGAEIEILDNKIVPFFEQILFEFIILNENIDEKVITEIVKSAHPSLHITFIDYVPKSDKTSKLLKYIKCDDNELLKFLSSRFDLDVDDEYVESKVAEIINQSYSDKKKIVYFPEKCMSASSDGEIRFHDKAAIEIYEKMKAQKSHSYEEIENAINALNKLKELKPLADELAQKVKQFQADYLEISADVHRMSETIKTRETLTNSIAKAENEITQNEKTLEVRMFERQKLQEQLDQLTSNESLSGKIRELNAQRDSRNTNIGIIQNKLISIRNETNRLQSDIDRDEKQKIEKSAAAKTYTPEMPESLTLRDEPNIRNQITEIDIKLRKMENLTSTYEQYERKKAEYDSHARKLKRTKSTFADLTERLDHERSLWQSQLQDYVDLINKHMRESLHERFSHIKVELTEPENIKRCGLNIEAKHRQAFIDSATRIRGLSGGERGIVTEAFIFATHLLTYSPLHVIDEFTQRMDLSTKELAFNIAASTAIRAQKMRRELNEGDNFSEYAYDPLFILACPDTTGLDFRENKLFEHLVCLRLADGNSNVLNK